MPQRELERLKAVNRFLKLEISKEKELQEIVDMAAMICGTSMALISLIDHDTQHILFKKGIDHNSAPREDTFCNYVLGEQKTLVVPDLYQDQRFTTNPLVTGDLHLRFYAGSAVTTRDGHSLGSLCVLDSSPKEVSPMQQQVLEILSKQAVQLLEFDVSLNILKTQFIKAKDSEIQLRAFFESSNDCHLLLDKELNVVAFNQSTSRFVKKTYKTTLTVGMNVRDYMYPDHIPNFILNCNKALNNEPVHFERFFQYDEEGIWWSTTYQPAFNEAGVIIGVSYNASNITKRMEHEQKILEQSERFKTIAYIQSHEMRRPVASILGLVNLFKMEKYSATSEELMMLEEAALELDGKIKTIVGYTV